MKLSQFGEAWQQSQISPKTLSGFVFSSVWSDRVNDIDQILIILTSMYFNITDNKDIIDNLNEYFDN